MLSSLMGLEGRLRGFPSSSSASSSASPSPSFPPPHAPSSSSSSSDNEKENLHRVNGVDGLWERLKATAKLPTPQSSKWPPPQMFAENAAEAQQSDGYATR